MVGIAQLVRALDCGSRGRGFESLYPPFLFYRQSTRYLALASLGRRFCRMSELPSDLPLPGRYRHYKGPEYVVLGVARHSETEEPLVVYRKDYGDKSLWVRPLEMFQETVTVDGQVVPRFKYLGEA